MEKANVALSRSPQGTRGQRHSNKSVGCARARVRIEARPTFFRAVFNLLRSPDPVRAGEGHRPGDIPGRGGASAVIPALRDQPRASPQQGAERASRARRLSITCASHEDMGGYLTSTSTFWLPRVAQLLLSDSCTNLRNASEAARLWSWRRATHLKRNNPEVRHHVRGGCRTSGPPAPSGSRSGRCRSFASAAEGKLPFALSLIKARKFLYEKKTL